MTLQMAAWGIVIALAIWCGLNVRHWRAVTAWASQFSRPRVPRDDQPRAVLIAALVAFVLAIGVLLEMRWAYALTVLLSAAGCVVESTVRVVPHLRAGEQRLAMQHIILSLPLLAALILAVIGWNRLPPLVSGA
ncbi:MAG: hypothetical protein Kow0047_33150 [Anaerolineae bacterium]